MMLNSLIFSLSTDVFAPRVSLRAAVFTFSERRRMRSQVRQVECPARTYPRLKLTWWVGPEPRNCNDCCSEPLKAYLGHPNDLLSAEAL